MRTAKAVWYLAVHSIRLWRTGQLRFRLETFGLYFPSPPYASPWWRLSPRTVLPFLRQLPAYAAWLAEMEDLRGGGPGKWWDERLETLRED